MVVPNKTYVYNKKIRKNVDYEYHCIVERLISECTTNNKNLCLQSTWKCKFSKNGVFFNEYINNINIYDTHVIYFIPLLLIVFMHVLNLIHSMRLGCVHTNNSYIFHLDCMDCLECGIYIYIYLNGACATYYYRQRSVLQNRCI